MEEISSTEGRQLENEVKKKIEDVIADRMGVKILQEHKILGLSAQWKVDIAVAAELLLYPGEYSLYLAIIECKNIGDVGHPYTYHTHMCRAYTELNDLRLNSKLGAPKFYLMVNRFPSEHEVKKNYHELFKNIGVKMINIHDPSEQTEFEGEMHSMLRKSTFEEQARKLEELCKIHNR